MTMEIDPSDSLCSGKFCRLIQGFQVPPEAELEDQFSAYLLDHGAAAGISIGTKREIQQRNNCPFCRFVQRGIPNCSFADAPDASECFVVLKFESDFWLQIQTPDSRDLGLLMTYSERIALVNRSDQAKESAGRIVNKRGLNYETVSRWLSLCDGLHQEICPAFGQTRLDRGQVPHHLRVVDVKDDCLVDIPWHERYVALSYVWGDAQPPKLFRHDVEELYNIGSIRRRRDQMPKTIQDVMTFTSCIGLRFLWFDSLCLIQDDAADLSRGIMNMDIVYESAYVTVIAANGSGADDGLPGVGQTSRQGQQDTEILKPGLELIRIYTLDEHLNKSTWATRGWTLQEHHLSRRTINFVNNQAYFRCRQRIWCEELWTDLNPKLQVSGEWTTNLVELAKESMDLEETVAAPHYYLFLAIERFQQRNLTDKNDAINAMTGILQRVAQRSKSVILEGLPVDLFPLACSFLHLRDDIPRRRDSFPSWSWAGWMGWPHWYAFYALNFDEHPEEVGEALAMTCAIFRKYNHLKDNGQVDEVIWTPEPSVLESILAPVLKFETHQTRQADVHSHNVTEPRNYSMLSVSAVAVHLRAKNPFPSLEPPMLAHRKTWALCDQQGHECGYVYLDTDLDLVSGQSLELLLLSKCYKVDYPIQKLMSGRETTQHVFWALFIVLMADGVYERRGLGQILESSISDSFEPGPRWQNVILG